MKIGKREVSYSVEPLIIAEIGINHGGSLELAKKMVLAAANAGAECVKHQTHFVEDEMSEEAKFIVPPNDHRSIWEIMDSCALSKDDEIELKRYTEELGVIYISTPFSRSAADFLAEIGIPAFKIGSGEADNLPLIRHIAGLGMPVIMSTGMQSITSMKQSVDILEGQNIDYALLECTNLYPSPPEIVSLKGITELRNSFPGALIGFSDHSIGSEMALASVALGACIIERHFTDSRYRKGPDISCSMDPLELSWLIRYSKEVFIATQNPKSRSKDEESVYKFARSSVVAETDLPAGTKITEADIWARRPGNGDIPGYEFGNIVGRKLKASVKKGQQLKYSDLV